MKTQTFVLDERYPDCTLTTYIHEPHAELQMPTRRAIIVCPGGGYGGLSEREAEPVALQYFAAGLNVFILRYSVREKAANNAPLVESALGSQPICMTFNPMDAKAEERLETVVDFPIPPFP